MFLAYDERLGGEPSFHFCKSCKQPIGAEDKVETVRFNPDPEHRLEEMNGTYHAACAKPFLSIAHALEMLSRPFF